MQSEALFKQNREHKASKNFYFKSNNTAIDATQAIKCININETHLNYCPIDELSFDLKNV